MSILRNRSLAALIAAEIVSSLGSRITFLALPWFVLVTTGSAARMGIVLAVELAPVALLGIPSGAVVAPTRCAPHDAAVGSRSCATDVLDSPPPLGGVAHLSTAPDDRLPDRVLPGAVLRLAARDPARLVGEDETTVAQANAVIEGATTLTNLLGPVVAGLLIAAVGTTSVLYIDAATFLLSFLTLTLFVPSRPPQPQTEDARGVFAGLRFLLRDPLLWRIGLAAVFLNMFGSALSAALPVLAFDEFSESLPRGRCAVRLPRRRRAARHGAGDEADAAFQPLKLAAVGIVALPLPIWLLGLDLPLWATMAALFVSTVPQPLVNAPVIGLMTTRTPEALRPKLMTALLTVAMLAGPVGLAAGGPLLEALGTRPVFAIIAAGMTVCALYFASVALRFGPRDLPETPAVAA